jgi:hypothetical protein
VVQEDAFVPQQSQILNLKQCEKQMNPQKVVDDTTEDNGHWKIKKYVTHLSL